VVNAVQPSFQHPADPRKIAQINIAGHTFEALLDSGATHSACSTNVSQHLQTLGIRVFPSEFPISDVQGKPLEVIGRTTVSFRAQTEQFKWEFLVINNLDNQFILGADFMKKYKLKLDFNDTGDLISTRQRIAEPFHQFIKHS